MKYTDKDFEKVVEKTRKKDGLPNVLFYRHFSIRITKLISKTNITPNQITIIGFIVNLFAAYFLFYRNSSAFLILAIFTLQIGRILDSVDGEIAILKNQCTKFGAWLDGVLDRISEMLILLSLTLHNYLIYNDVTVLFLFLGFYLIVFITTYSSLFSETLFKKNRREINSGFIAKISRFLGIKPSYITWEGSLVTALLTFFIIINQIQILFLILISIVVLFGLIQVYSMIRIIGS